MTYTVAEAERILAEAKAREAAVDPLLIEAREICAQAYSDSVSLGASAFAERKRAGGVKATAPHLAAMEAAAEALEEAIAWDGYDDDDVPAVWLNQADTALTQLTAQIEAARKGE